MSMTKSKKRFFLSELTRQKFIVDEQRILNLYRRFNFEQPFNVRKDLISLLDGYLFYPKQFDTTQTVYDFTRLSHHERKTFLHNWITAKHKTQSYSSSFLFSSRDTTATSIHIKSSTHYEFRGVYTGKIFVPKFYQDRANQNFLQFMRLVKKHPAKRNYLTENGTYRRVLYEYVPKSSRHAYSFAQRNLEFPFPDKWYPNKGYTITGFLYVFKDASVKINNLLKPSDSLINDFANDNKEDFDHSLIANIFFDADKF